MEVVTNSILGLGPGGVIISMKEPFKTTIYPLANRKTLVQNEGDLVKNGSKEDIWEKRWVPLWVISFFIQVPNEISLFQALKLIYIF